jgi:hypothetical protein
MWNGDADSSPRGVLSRGDEGVLVLVSVEVRIERSPVIRMEEKVDQGRVGGAFVRSPLRSSRTMEWRLHM